jgi:hypothetical protein
MEQGVATEFRRIEHKLDIIIEILQYGQLKRAADKLKLKTQALRAALGPTKGN